MDAWQKGLSSSRRLRGVDVCCGSCFTTVTILIWIGLQKPHEIMTNLLNHDECWRMLCGVHELGLVVLHGVMLSEPGVTDCF